jgi:hypothetical protein
MVFETSWATSQQYSARSANFAGRISNRWTVNNNAATGANRAFNGDNYVANTNHNYLFTCNDRFMEPIYTFTMVITDQDVTGVYPNVNQNSPTLNQFPDWDPAGWGN